MVGKNQCKLVMIMLLKVVLDRNYTTIQAIQPLSKLKSCIISFILHKNFFFFVTIISWTSTKLFISSQLVCFHVTMHPKSILKAIDQNCFPRI